RPPLRYIGQDQWPTLRRDPQGTTSRIGLLVSRRGVCSGSSANLRARLSTRPTVVRITIRTWRSFLLAAFSDHLARATLQATFFRSRRIRTSVGRMHVMEAQGHGHLPPLVLLHGLSSTGVHYLPLVGHVRPHVRRLFLPDLPGHGFSES